MLIKIHEQHKPTYKYGNIFLRYLTTLGGKPYNNPIINNPIQTCLKTMVPHLALHW